MLHGAVKKEEKKKAEGILKKKKNCSIVYSLSNFSTAKPLCFLPK